MKVIELTNDDPDFYRLLGPYLSRRDVVAAVGGTLWDEDIKTWLIALDKSSDGAVAGFVSVAARGPRLHVESLYTPGVAGGGLDQAVSRRLIAAVVKRFGGRQLHGKVRRSRTAAYLKSGFTEVETGSTAEYAHLLREPGVTK